MRKQLLLSTAAVLAGISLASAQGMPGAQSSGSSNAAGHAQQSTQPAQPAQSRSGQAQQGAQEQSKQGQSQRSEGSSGQREPTTGQSSQSQQGRQGQREPNAQGRHEPTSGQSGRSEREPASGQNTHTQRDQGRQTQQPARNQPEQATKQNQQPQSQGQAAQQRKEAQPSQTQPQQGQAQQNQQGSAPGHTQTGAAQTQAGGRVTLNADQQTRIRETVLTRSDVPRLNRVNFALSAGTMVPTSVHVVAVPETLFAIYPEWREDMYFVVRDDIIIVDHSHRIVAVLPVGSSGARAQYGSSGSQGSGMAMQLSRDEIRQVQIILNQKGFNIGEPDGVLGERTRAALIQFQRQQGFQASGHMDQQTMGALGVSKAGTGQQGQQTQPSSTGQAGGTMNHPNANQGTAAGQPSNNQGAGQPSTAGQAGGRAEQPASKAPPANHGTGTSGQSSPQTPQNMNPNTGTGSSMPQQHTK